MVDARDTIPRLQQLTPHMRAQLIGLRGADQTFEQSRQRFIETVNLLEAEGLGRRTASRVGDQDAYWAPTADVLDEAMRLGFVERQRLPSARRYLGAHRHRCYRLTASGENLGALAQDDIGAFFDRLTQAVFDAHPYFRALTLGLVEHPLVCPLVSEGEVEEARKAGLSLDHWTELVAQQLTQAQPEPVNAPRARDIIATTIKRRFGQHKPTSKALSEAINDSFTSVALAERQLDFGVTELKILRHWGAQLRVLDQSRYVTAYPRANVIWLASDIEADRHPAIVRRGLTEHRAKVAKSLITAYHQLAGISGSALNAPYLPIFLVRAAAAFECRVTRALVDLVIEQLAAGEIPDQHIHVLLHLGTTRQPGSEPVYRRRGTRRFEMTMRSSKEMDHGRS